MSFEDAQYRYDNAMPPDGPDVVDPDTLPITPEWDIALLGRHLTQVYSWARMIGDVHHTAQAARWTRRLVGEDEWNQDEAWEFVAWLASWKKTAFEMMRIPPLAARAAWQIADGARATMNSAVAAAESAALEDEPDDDAGDDTVDNLEEDDDDDNFDEDDESNDFDEDGRE